MRRLARSAAVLALSVVLLPGALACAWAIEELAREYPRGWS